MPAPYKWMDRPQLDARELELYFRRVRIDLNKPMNKIEETETMRLRAALSLALSIIENYELDIRARPDLIKQGFCQGQAYRHATSDIKRLAGIELDALDESKL